MRKLDGVEGLAPCISLSTCIVVFIGQGLNYTPRSIRYYYNNLSIYRKIKYNLFHELVIGGGDGRNRADLE